ncbi:hypothetical protein [Peribacillus sp. SCS-155]|uniref:hypothetical protein n=1 Tax=Peribacillus sedimenti TaxID=3115297 RepID=UPI0039060689
MLALCFKDVPFSTAQDLTKHPFTNSLTEYNISVTSTESYNFEFLRNDIEDKLLHLEKATVTDKQLLLDIESKLSNLSTLNDVEEFKYRIITLKLLYTANDLLRVLEDNPESIDNQQLKEISFSIHEASFCPLKTNLEERYQAIYKEYSARTKVNEMVEDINSKENFKTIKTAKELETLLINELGDDYINIGKDGRKVISEELLPNLETFNNIDKMMNTVTKKIAAFKSKLKKVKEVSSVVEFQSILNELHLEYNDQPTEKTEVMYYAIKSTSTEFTTIGELKNYIEEALDSKQGYTSTISNLDGVATSSKTGEGN